MSKNKTPEQREAEYQAALEQARQIIAARNGQPQPQKSQEQIEADNRAIEEAMMVAKERIEVATKEFNSEEIVRLFNANPKAAIESIINHFEPLGVEPSKQIAKFFKEQKMSLDLEAVGDYLSGPEDKNKKVLGHFVDSMNFEGKPFVLSLRAFLKDFKLPGEAQKIDRLMEAFAGRYQEQNPDVIAHKDAAYLLSFQTIMLNTDLHNPSVKPDKKMTLAGLVNNLRGANKGSDEPDNDFDPLFLESIYKEIKERPFVLNFTKVAPGITIEPSKKEIQAVTDKFELEEGVKVEIKESKSLFSALIGYKQEISIKEKDGSAVTLQVYQPGWFSSKKPAIIIQPKEGKDVELNKKSLELAAKVANGFESPVKSVKASYGYQAEEMVTKLKEAGAIGKFSEQVLKSGTNKERQISH